MRMIDTKCPACGHITIDVLLRVKDTDGNYVMPYCRERTVDPEKLCGTLVERTLVGGYAAHVHPDDIPGGVWIRHGICNLDGSPRQYFTKSEMARVAKERGLHNHVEHVVSPRSGSDKSRFTQRFI